MCIIDHVIKQMVQQLAPWSKHKRAFGLGLPQIWTNPLVGALRHALIERKSHLFGPRLSCNWSSLGLDKKSPILDEHQHHTT